MIYSCNRCFFIVFEPFNRHIVLKKKWTTDAWNFSQFSFQYLPCSTIFSHIFLVLCKDQTGTWQKNNRGTAFDICCASRRSEEGSEDLCYLRKQCTCAAGPPRWDQPWVLAEHGPSHLLYVICIRDAQLNRASGQRESRLSGWGHISTSYQSLPPCFPPALMTLQQGPAPRLTVESVFSYP